MSFWDESVSEAKALTKEDLLAAFDALEESEYRVCPHVVHPKEMERGGLAVCASCFAVIDLGSRP